MSSEVNDSFLITSTNKEEIYQIRSCLISNKFCGPDSIPTKRLHLLQDQILNHLATIFDVSNYRPSSLLSNIDKIFEKLMHRRLIEFLEGKQIFYYRQFGFRKDFSTNYAILTSLESIQKALDD